MNRKTVAIDFDGTIATRNDYLPDRIAAEPMPGAHAALAELAKRFKVYIYTTRLSPVNNRSGMQLLHNYRLLKNWMDQHGFVEGEHYHDMTGIKVRAKYYIDDHGIRFNNWPSVMGQIKHIETDTRYQSQINDRKGII